MASAEVFSRIALHPLRAMILSILCERTASPKQISELLDEPLRSVSHQVAQLRSADLIELVWEEKRGGLVEHFYRGDVPVDEELDKIGVVPANCLARSRSSW